MAAEPRWAAYQEAFRKLVSRVDGVEREASPWPDWAITTVIETRDHWQTVWRAVSCHESQITAYEKLQHLSPQSHEALWGWQSFYRAFSTVNGGRAREHDLFEGSEMRTIRREDPAGRCDGRRDFRALGHRLVDQIAELIERDPRRPRDSRRVAGGTCAPRSVWAVRCRSTGADAGALLE